MSQESRTFVRELSPTDTGKAPLATIEKELTINFHEARERKHTKSRPVSSERSSSREVRRRRKLHSADGRQEGTPHVPRRNKTPERGCLRPIKSDIPDEKNDNNEIVETTITEAEDPVAPPDEPQGPSFLFSLFELQVQLLNEWPDFVRTHSTEWQQFKADRNRCFCDFIILVIYCGFGGFMFRFFESAFEHFYKCGVKRVKRDFVDGLWARSQELDRDEWKSLARRKLMEFENQLQEAYDAGMNTYSGKRSWSFLNAVVYCITVVTTIGYGHIVPSTNTGRAVTIAYAIFGIPLFLILLADFGKMFTRGIKFLWAFVRRLYYTGSCRKVRRTVPVQEVMRGMQRVYDIARFQRSPGEARRADPGSQTDATQCEELEGKDPELGVQQEVLLEKPEDQLQDPATPALSNFCVDDEFNLPISVALTILVGYILFGALLYCMWEDWSFFEAFYFVFISMSTIGFGDYVPNHPMFMMGSIIYLVFGLALTSMCINVVQAKLSDTFRHASAKIGASLGLRIAEAAEKEANRAALAENPVELAEVHSAVRKASEENLDGLSPVKEVAESSN